jgi:hypothetical protein
MTDDFFWIEKKILDMTHMDMTRCFEYINFDIAHGDITLYIFRILKGLR